jgi:hypothetical protein
VSSGCVSWYLFNGFTLVENSVGDFFPPTKTSVDLPWEEVGGGNEGVPKIRLIDLKHHIDYFSKGPKSSRTDRTQKKEVVSSKLNFKFS